MTNDETKKSYRWACVSMVVTFIVVGVVMSYLMYLIETWTLVLP